MAKDDVISTLNDLIETCEDGEQGFSTCAENVNDSRLRTVFTEGARRCADSADELRIQVQRLGGDAESGGTVSGALHRGWVNIKSTVTGKDDTAILNEAERGEDVAVKAYREALESDLPSDVRAIVQRQYQGVEENHNIVRDLRNQYRAAS